MADMKIVGLEKLQKQLKSNATLNDVKKVVKQNGAEMQQKAMRKVPVAPVNGGTLKRSIELDLTDGGMSVEVEAKAEYAGYVEYGTRFMQAQPFLRPSLEEQAKQFKADMQKLTK